MTRLPRFRCLVAFCIVAAGLGCERSQPFGPVSDVSAASVGNGGAPAAPSTPSAVAASSSRIDLSWRDNSTNETGFEIRRSTIGPDGSFPVLATTTTNVTSYADTGLRIGTQYCYKLRAVSVTRKTTTYSMSTDPVCATTPVPPGPPQAPEDAIAAGVGSHAIGVSWTDKANNEAGFRVERSSDGGTTWVTAATTAANVSSIADGDVPNEGQQFCYRVSAFNGDGVSAPSNTSCTMTVAGPSDLAIDSLGSLTWKDNSGIEDGYEVWILDGFGEPAYDGLIATVPPNTTSFQTGGCALWCHGFGVIAFKNGAYSDWAGVMLPAAAPDSLTAIAGSASEIDLAWRDEPNGGELPAQSFMIERCTGEANACSETNFIQIASFVSGLTFRDLQVLPGATYTYRVRAYGNQGYTGFSNAATATVP